MTHPRSKLPVLLLALLLALMPMQSLLAGMLAPPASADSHGMGHSPAMHMHAGGKGAMDPGCRHCQSPDECAGQGCSLSHCLSCVPVLPSQQRLGMTTLRSIIQAMAQERFDSHFASHPFRPPIA